VAGNLEFRYSAMNSGKTTNAIQMAYNYRENGHEIIVAKPGIDSKGGDKITSRVGLEMDVDVLIKPSDVPSLLFAKTLGETAFNTLSAVIIDEAQFLEPIQVDDIWRFTTSSNTHVIAYGLRTDFQMRGFPGASRLLELADKSIEISTTCAHKLCGKKARCNTRQINGIFVFEGDQVAIDGEDEVTYKSLCKMHYLVEQAKALAA
jgi:thymidine kinase